MCVTEGMMAAFAKYGGEDNCINGTCICFSNLCNQGSALLLLHTLVIGGGAILLLVAGYGGGGGNLEEKKITTLYNCQEHFYWHVLYIRKFTFTSCFLVPFC